MSPSSFTPPGLHRPKVAPPVIRREVGKVLSQIAGEAARLPEPYVRALRPILLEAQAEVAASLRAWVRDMPDGELRFTAQRYRAALLQLKTALRVLERTVPSATRDALVLGGAAAGDAALRHLAEEVAAFAAVFGQSVRPLQLDQSAILARGDRMLIPRYRATVLRYGKAMSDDFKRQLALGVVQGETFTELTERLVRHGGPRGVVSLRGVLGEDGSVAQHISEGLFVRYRPWAERIVRTEVLNAYNVHHLEGLHQANRDDPGYMKRWDATIDRVCPICKELDGKVAELDRSFHTGHRRPPAHPNCRCALTPWRPEWAG